MVRPAKLIDRRVALNMPSDELTALDEYCALMRRATGGKWSRAEVIRVAVLRFITEDQMA